MNQVRVSMKRGNTMSSFSILLFTLNVLSNVSDDSLITEGWIQDMPFQVTISTKVPVIISRSDIISGQKLRQLCVLKMVCGVSIPILE